MKRQKEKITSRKGEGVKGEREEVESEGEDVEELE